MRNIHRKALITEETLAESARLKELWGKHKTMTQVEFGETYGIGSQGAVYQFLNGLTPISLKAAIGFAEGLGIEVGDFSPRLANEMTKIADAVPTNEDNYVAIKMLFVGDKAEIIETSGSLQLKRSLMISRGFDISSSATVHITDESMEPTITNDAIVLIAQNDTSLKNGNIYAFVQDGKLQLKRFFHESAQWVARSDNSDKARFPDILLSKDAVILGRSIWVGMIL